MCLGMPMKILSITADRAVGDALGVRREISLALLPQPWPVVGDFVMVHVGYAIECIDAAIATESHELWRAMQAGDHA
jgi:hydrogenase expression/formation protein HypC